MIRNATRDTVIARNAVNAKSMFSRMRGMLGRDFSKFDAMIFERNNSIHMFFMHMALDILFLDKQGKVLGIRHELRPWRMAAEWKSSTVIELPPGSLSQTETQVGDHIEVEPSSTI